MLLLDLRLLSLTFVMFEILAILVPWNLQNSILCL